MHVDMPQQGTFIKRQLCPTGPLPVYALAGHKDGMLNHNIAALRNGRGFSQTQLAEAVGTSLNMLGKLERGDRELTSTWIEKISAALEVEPYVLFAPLDADGTLKKSKSGKPPEAANDDEAVPIIALDLSLSMGPGTLIEEFVESEPIMFDLRLLQIITRTPSDRLRMVRGIGDSMEPTLRTGDRVLVDINERSLSRMGIYWIDYLGAHGIKRLRPAGRGRVMIMSDNPVEPDFEADAGDVRIEGRVIWFAREL